MLPLETLKTFLKMGIEAPKGNDDVPRAIADVEAKKRDYEEKRDKAAAEPEPEEEEAEEDAKEEQEEEEGVEDDGQEGGKQESNKDSGPDAAGPTPAEANGGVKAVVMPVTVGKDGADAAADGAACRLPPLQHVHVLPSVHCCCHRRCMRYAATADELPVPLLAAPAAPQAWESSCASQMTARSAWR